jgi:hypothetical protein
VILQLSPLLSVIRLEEGEGIVYILDGVGLGRKLFDEDPLPPHQLGHAQRAEKDAHFEPKYKSKGLKNKNQSHLYRLNSDSAEKDRKRFQKNSRAQLTQSQLRRLTRLLGGFTVTATLRATLHHGTSFDSKQSKLEPKLVSGTIRNKTYVCFGCFASIPKQRVSVF